MAFNMHGYRWMSICVAAGLLLVGTVRAQDNCPYLCNDGVTCVYPMRMCDGVRNCPGGDDEGVVCNDVQCTEEQYECSVSRELGMTPMCIPLSYQCDETEDCALGEDELDCDYSCARDEYRCADGTCIPDTYICDFIYDCYGRDDEANCTYPACTSDQFRCTTGHCIASDHVCNSNWDCGDGSDETDEMCTEPEVCEVGQFVCTTSRACVDYLLLCNGQSDCDDGSDENTCGVDECNPADGSGSPCGYQCQNTLISYNCLCPTGYRLGDDQSTCEEVNECVENPLPCDQGCENTDGSYTCSCVSGYHLITDGHSCEVDLDPDNVPFLVFANRYYVRRMNLDGTGMTELLTNTELVHILDFDSVDGNFYYADARHGYIRMIAYDHNETVSEPVVVNWHNLPLIEGIAVDWVGRKLYWTDSVYYSVSVSELNGTFVKTLISGVTQRPRGIVVDPSKGYVFWTDWYIPPFIARMGMDGSDFTKILTENLFWPNGITLDPFIDRIWWADAYLNTIECADLDGNNRYVVTENLPHVYAISIFEEWVYLTDWNIKTLEKANRFTGENRTQILPLSHEPYDIHVVHPSLQPRSPNPCGNDNGGCSHLCLISTGGSTYTCACPNDFDMNSDNKTCTPGCSEAQFTCERDDHRCIPARWVCDGEPDCKSEEDEDNCPVRSCPVGMFQCTDSTEDDPDCTYFTKQCDGVSDCADNSDENPDVCQGRVCLESEFLCNDTGRCIPGSWVCDTEDDCQNGMDEYDSCSVPADGCQDGEFTCDNGQCIPQSWWCDLDDDCGDNSDEANRTVCWDQRCPDGWRRCEHSYRCIPEILFCDHNDDCRDNSDEPDDPDQCPPCPDGDYQCHSGQCIPERWRCDFMEDCEDGTDEDEHCSPSDYPDCDEGEFRCANHRCIRQAYICDTDNDCLDNSDETAQLCGSFTCPEGKFQCDSGHCIPASYQCDQDRDCLDASDEADCPDQECYSFEFRCDNTVCIPLSWQCDTDNDCGDGSDETLDVCLAIDCGEYSRAECDNGRCVRPSQLCNREQDCEDGSDENDFNLCIHNEDCTEGDMFRCNDGQHTCIDRALVCDLYADCANATDEIVCQHGTASDPRYCTPTSCMQTCINNTDIFGHYCHCNEGYMADPTDRTACVDVDECASKKLNFCPQLCMNLKGGYTCDCVGDFVSVDPDRDHALCEPADGSRGTMLVGIHNTVRQLRIEDMQYTDAAVFGRKAYRVTADSHRGMFYWADDITKEIYRGLVPPSAAISSVANTVISSSRGLSRPAGLAIDWIALNLYFTDYDQGRIYVSNADGNYMKILIQGTDRKPTYIALSPELGRMFWAEPVFGRVMSAWMDGSNDMVLTRDVIEPTGIVVDHFMNNRIYWTDGKKNTIESMNWNGTDRVVVLSENLQKPYGLDILFDKMFWISQESGSVYQMDKFGRGVNMTLITGSGVVDDIAMHHSMKYPNVTRSNPCATNPCWPLCLLTPTSYKCACPEGAVFTPGSNSVCMAEGTPMNNAGEYARLVEEQSSIMPILCPCVETQLCENLDAGADIPDCECRDGVSASNCVSSVSPGSPTTTSSGSATTTSNGSETTTSNESETTTRNESETTTSNESETTTSHESATRAGSTHNESETVAIIVVVLVLILVLVLVALFFAYRRGMFMTCMKVKTPGGGTVVFENHNHGIANPAMGAPVVEYSVTGEDLSTRFSNPMYDKLNTNLQPGAAPQADPPYEELPAKVPPTSNGHFSSA